MTAIEQDELRHLVRLLRDGEQFYSDAARRVEDRSQRALFKEMSLAKASMSSALAAKLTLAEGAAFGENPWIGNVRQCYARCRSRIGSANEEAYIPELEAAEDRILDGFREALGVITDPAIRRSVESRYPHAVDVQERLGAQTTH